MNPVQALRVFDETGKVRKRDLRSLWLVSINGACRENGLSYSRLIAGL